MWPLTAIHPALVTDIHNYLDWKRFFPNNLLFDQLNKLCRLAPAILHGSETDRSCVSK
jgi:hypothetical protein